MPSHNFSSVKSAYTYLYEEVEVAEDNYAIDCCVIEK